MTPPSHTWERKNAQQTNAERDQAAVGVSRHHTAALSEPKRGKGFSALTNPPAGVDIATHHHHNCSAAFELSRRDIDANTDLVQGLQVWVQRTKSEMHVLVRLVRDALTAD